MGQTLSEPVREKHSSEGHDARLLFAASAMQGWRISMEDAHTALLELANLKGFSFFGVYDGHGGQNVAKYSGANLHTRIANHEAFAKGDYVTSIKQGFLGTDEDLKKDPQFANDPSGCTAVTALITPDNRIFVGNAGDSRAVLSLKGDASPMSSDHKPVNKEESSRIVKAGGFVEFGRVNGNLALSRAIGDFEFKQNSNLSAEYQIVTALPEVSEHTINPESEFIILACDGIWDCLSSNDVVGFIRRDIARGNNLKQVCENLMERCLAKDSELGGIGCDNMTVIIVAFLQGKTEQAWYDWIASRVDAGIGTVLTEDEKSSYPQTGFQEDDYSIDEFRDELEEDLEIPADATGDDFPVPEDNESGKQNIITPDTPSKEPPRTPNSTPSNTPSVAPSITRKDSNPTKNNDINHNPLGGTENKPKNFNTVENPTQATPSDTTKSSLTPTTRKADETPISTEVIKDTKAPDNKHTNREKK